MTVLSELGFSPDKFVAVGFRASTQPTALLDIGISKLGLKGRQDIAGGEAPCKDDKIIQAPKGRQDVLFS
jgi:hypothetical protein